MLSIRKVEEKDCENIYNWSNDPLTRKNSLNSEPINYNDHLVWFKSKLVSDDSLFFIVSDSKDVGLVRFEKKDNEWSCGIVVSTESRGQGHGKLMLALGLEQARKNKISSVQAKIKKDNISSIKIFEYCGFEFKKSENGVLEYIWSVDENR